MSRFKNFTDSELDILEDALCQYGNKTLIKEIRLERDKREKPIAELTTITTSDGKEYDVENDCLIRKSEAIKQIYEKSLRIDNPDTRNGLTGAVAILWELKGEQE